MIYRVFYIVVPVLSLHYWPLHLDALLVGCSQLLYFLKTPYLSSFLSHRKDWVSVSVWTGSVLCNFSVCECVCIWLFHYFIFIVYIITIEEHSPIVHWSNFCEVLDAVMSDWVCVVSARSFSGIMCNDGDWLITLIWLSGCHQDSGICPSQCKVMPVVFEII